MRHKGTARLETERLVLRRFTLSDAAEMFSSWACDDRVTKFMSWQSHKNMGETLTILELWSASYIKDDFYQWGIEYDGLLIGSIGVVNIDERNRCAEVGYCIAYRFWNRGITSEALAAVLRFLLDAVGVKRICARHDLENPASGCVMQKCGMVKEGVLRGAMRRHDGSYGDMALYGILNGEMPVLRGGV